MRLRYLKYILFSVLFLGSVSIVILASVKLPSSKNTTTVKSLGSFDIHVPPPPLSEDYFPCSACHNELEVNRNRRELKQEHTNIILKHDEEHRWCLDCHNPNNRDKLRLANGDLVDFTESYKLCGQCHGTIYRDWRFGVHGKRTGSWSDQKTYLLCAHCHDPHSPKFKQLKPEKPPVRPEEIRR